MSGLKRGSWRQLAWAHSAPAAVLSPPVPPLPPQIPLPLRLCSPSSWLPAPALPPTLPTAAQLSSAAMTIAVQPIEGTYQPRSILVTGGAGGVGEPPRGARHCLQDC